MAGNVGGKRARQLIRLRILDKRKEKKALRLLEEASTNWTGLQQVLTVADQLCCHKFYFMYLLCCVAEAEGGNG